MLEATKVKMSGTKTKVNRKTYNISSMKPETRKFLEGSRCSHAKKKKQPAKKCTMCCTCKAAFFLLLIVVYFKFTVNTVNGNCLKESIYIFFRELKNGTLGTLHYRTISKECTIYL